MRVLKAASWAAVVALLCSLLVVGAPSGASASAPPPVSPSRAHGTTSVTGPHHHGHRSVAPDPLGDPGTTLFGAKFSAWLLDKAGGAAASEGIGMIFSLSGLNNLIAPDPNTALLKEILRQLTRIQRDIDQLNRNLSDLINQLSRDNLERLLIELRQNVTLPLDHLFTYEFQRVVDAAEEYADAVEHNPVRLTPTYDELIKRRNEFYVAYDAC